MQIDHAGLVAGACAILAVAAADLAALKVAWQGEDRTPVVRDGNFGLQKLQAAYRPAPGWLHDRGMPGGASDTAAHALTSAGAASTMHLWMPQP